jgi:hypothetical protein
MDSARLIPAKFTLITAIASSLGHLGRLDAVFPYVRFKGWLRVRDER